MSQATPAPHLIVTDSRTGRSYTLPIMDGAVRTADLRQIVTGPGDFGLMGYDPAFLNTASCRSAVTFIDGDQGILRYRGYPIEQLAEGATFLEVAHLLRHGELPDLAAYNALGHDVAAHSAVPDGVMRLIESFPRTAHPMAVLTSAMAALAAYAPGASAVRDGGRRSLVYPQILGQVATAAALVLRHRTGTSIATPDPRFGERRLGFTENFLRMAGMPTHPALVRAMDVLFTLHADHEQNCSTNAVRAVGSSEADPFQTVASGIAALSGPLHGGANEAVLRMLEEIGDRSAIPTFVASVKAGQGKLMGFGHRVYKSYDPRARIVKQLVDEVFAVTGRDATLDLAVELERIALSDEYFVSRKLYPNVDFYTGLIYRAMGFPTEYFTVLFAVARTAGWLAQWEELMMDREQKIARPRQLYTGSAERPFMSRLA